MSAMLFKQTPRPVELLRDLPKRTQARRVGCFMHSSKAADAEIAALIAEVAFSTKTVWGYKETLAIIEDLRGCEKRLDRWLTTQRAKQ